MKSNMLLLIFCWLIGCTPAKNQSDESSLLQATIVKDLDKVSINVDKSIVNWKGTKLMGTGSHSGKVSFEEGFLLLNGEELKGGNFVVDMTTIYNTDIPLSDPVPRKNLTEHLSSDFEVSHFGEAKFVITDVQQNKDAYRITGNLTIKGITKEIRIEAIRTGPGTYSSEFSFDRFDWKIGEDGSWLEKKVVDPDVLIQVTIVTGK